MQRTEDKCEILYLGKEKCMYSILLSILFNSFISIVFNNMPNSRNNMRSVLYLIGSFTIIFLFESIIGIYKKRDYLIVSFIYTFIALFSIYSMIPVDFINIHWIKVLNSKIFFNTIYIEMLGMAFEYINRHTFKLSYRISVLKLVIFTCLSFVVIHSCLLMNKFSILLIFNSCLFIYFIVNIYRFSKIKFKIGNRINVILLLTCILASISILNILSIKINKSSFIITEILDIMVLISFVLITVFVVNKLVNAPYKTLFGDVYKEGLEMELLNNRVVKKNRELEFSQALVKKKEKMFKTFFVNMPIPLVLLSKNGRIIFANSSFQKLIEENKIKNIINKKIFKVIDFNDEDILEILSEEDKEINATIECEKEKKYVSIEVIHMLQNSTEILMIFHDITSRIKVNKLKVEMKNNKFQEKIKNDFLSNISHDLKTPVNVIYSAAQLVPVFIKNNNKEALKKYNTICKINCLSLIRLTNNLIDSSRIYSDYLAPNLQVKNIVEIIESAVMSLVDYAKNKEIDLVFDTDEEEIYVKVDEEFMQRIVINLISNSIKFTSEEGRIEVFIKDKEDKVSISVQDNGIGMSKEFVEKAFDKYAMEENNAEYTRKGTGIGLFVVKKLVEKQNGNIDIESKIDVGTKVEMIFYKEI